MKQDEFVSWVTHVTVWVEANRKTVIGIAGSIVALLVLIVGAVAWQHSRSEKAYTLLGTVQKLARAPSAGDPGAGPGESRERAVRVVEAADTLLRDYGTGAAADWARYYRGAALLDLDRKDDAAEAIAPVLKSAGDELLGNLSRLLNGRIEEARGDLQRAADAYASAAEKSSPRFPAEIALMSQARCLTALGKKQDAINAYQKILDVYPESPLAGKISEKLQELRGAS